MLQRLLKDSGVSWTQMNIEKLLCGLLCTSHWSILLAFLFHPKHIVSSLGYNPGS